MKIFNKRILVLMMIFAATISSCSSDDDNKPNGDGAYNGSFTALVNGENYRSLPEKAEAMVAVIDGRNFVSIAGSSEEGYEIGISTENFNGVGTYSLFDLEGNTGLGMYLVGDGDDAQIWMMPIEGEVGKLVVTEYAPNKRIKGTFNFTVMNPMNNSIKRITDGVFDVRVGTGTL